MPDVQNLASPLAEEEPEACWPAVEKERIQEVHDCLLQLAPSSLIGKLPRVGGETSMLQLHGME